MGLFEKKKDDLDESLDEFRKNLREEIEEQNKIDKRKGVTDYRNKLGVLVDDSGLEKRLVCVNGVVRGLQIIPSYKVVLEEKGNRLFKEFKGEMDIEYYNLIGFLEQNDSFLNFFGSFRFNIKENMQKPNYPNLNISLLKLSNDLNKEVTLYGRLEKRKERNNKPLRNVDGLKKDLKLNYKLNIYNVL